MRSHLMLGMCSARFSGASMLVSGGFMHFRHQSQACFDFSLIRLRILQPFPPSLSDFQLVYASNFCALIAGASIAILSSDSHSCSEIS